MVNRNFSHFSKRKSKYGYPITYQLSPTVAEIPTFVEGVVIPSPALKTSTEIIFARIFLHKGSRLGWAPMQSFMWVRS